MRCVSVMGWREREGKGREEKVSEVDLVTSWQQVCPLFLYTLMSST